MEDEAEDARLLRRAAGVTDAPGMICPVSFRAPLSPHIAARREGGAWTRGDYLARIAPALEALRARHEFLLVEGVGGFRVPLADDWTVAEFAAWLGAPVLVAAADRLGVLSHTLLTLDAVAAQGLPAAGVVLNRAAPPDFAAESNADALRLATDVPVFGPLPHGPGGVTAEAMADAIEACGAGRALFG